MRYPFGLALLLCSLTAMAQTDWLAGPQVWRYDTEEPVLELGEAGAFDDTHVFAPCVYFEDGQYTMFYSGSQGAVADRVFRMGRAVSTDGVHFTKDNGPVFEFGDGRHSILTPTLLRGENGAVLRENGRLQLWFASADMTQSGAPHALYRSDSADGTTWTPPSAPLLENVYAPTIIRDGDRYRMWYTDVSGEPWVIRHADSPDGNAWRVTETPCIVIDQAWEKNRLFYPGVVKTGSTYVMWYGAYWTARPDTTAIGCAVSEDGITWNKHASNPVVRPNPTRPWESHYTTSQTVMKLPDGRWRIWYGSRKEPPFVNKYFAVGTAVWNGPRYPDLRAMAWPDRAAAYRKEMAAILTLPVDRVALDGTVHRTGESAACRVESISYASEEGSRVTALLWLPRDATTPVPAIVVACGHGGSKSCAYAQYAGQLYASLGMACLAIDTIGEEERNAEGRMGSRAHDLYDIPKPERAAYMTDELKRSVLGKIVWDLMRGLDYLESRSEVDASRMAVVGYSLGGASASALAILDSRIDACIISGWGLTPLVVTRGKECTQLPYVAFSDLMRFDEMTALLAPHCAALFYSGDSDAVIDGYENGPALVRDITAAVHGAKNILADADLKGTLAYEFDPGADHRPLFLAPDGARWMQEHLQRPGERRTLPEKTVRFGDWVTSQGQEIESLYRSEEREGGLAVVDVGATLFPPEKLACFPGETTPDPKYTFEGWVDMASYRAVPPN